MSTKELCSQKLTPKQKLFIDHLMINGRNGAAAARSAGVSRNRAAVAATEWLQLPHVKREVAKRESFIEERYKKELDRVIEQVVQCMLVEPDDIMTEDHELLPLSEMTQRGKAAFNGLKVKFDKFGNKEVEYQVVDKKAAMDMALRIKGAYAATKTETTQTVTLNTDSLYGKPPATLDYAERRILEVEAMEIVK